MIEWSFKRYSHIAAVLIIPAAHIAQRVSKMRHDQHSQDPGNIMVTSRVRFFVSLVCVHDHGQTGGLGDHLEKSEAHLHEGRGRLAHQVAAHQQSGDHGTGAGRGGKDEMLPVAEGQSGVHHNYQQGDG